MERKLQFYYLEPADYMIEEITKLTEYWYKLIGPNHHKDRDCHWYIETKWSYGEKPKYVVQHYGYLIDRIEEECENYELALEFLKNTLTYEIEEYKNYLQNEQDYTGWG
jgi:hypothetical protein